MHRPHGRRHRHPHGALDGRRQTLRLDDRPVGFGEGRADGSWPGVVGYVQANQVGKAAGVTGESDYHHGQAARPDVDQLSHRLGQAGAQMHHHYGGGKVGLGVTARHRRYRTLVQAENAVNIGPGVQLVEKQGFPGA